MPKYAHVHKTNLRANRDTVWQGVVKPVITVTDDEGRRDCHELRVYGKGGELVAELVYDPTLKRGGRASVYLIVHGRSEEVNEPQIEVRGGS